MTTTIPKAGDFKYGDYVLKLGMISIGNYPKEDTTYCSCIYKN
jgi:hypothetical protein